MNGLLPQAGIASRAFHRAVVMLDLLAHARMFGEYGGLGMRKATRAGVQSLNLRMAGAGFDHVIAVKDGHPARAPGAMALECTVSMNQ
jgi:hypothetical protein